MEELEPGKVFLSKALQISKRAPYDLLQGRGLDLPFDQGAIIRQPKLEYGAFGFQDIQKPGSSRSIRGPCGFEVLLGLRQNRRAIQVGDLLLGLHLSR